MESFTNLWPAIAIIDRTMIIAPIWPWELRCVREALPRSAGYHELWSQTPTGPLLSFGRFLDIFISKTPETIRNMDLSLLVVDWFVHGWWMGEQGERVLTKMSLVHNWILHNSRVFASQSHVFFLKSKQSWLRLVAVLSSHWSHSSGRVPIVVLWPAGLDRRGKKMGSMVIPERRDQLVNCSGSATASEKF